MRRLVKLVFLAFALMLALPAALPTAHGASPNAPVVPPATLGHDHPASDGVLTAGARTLADWDAPPDAATASVADPRNPQWVTYYGTKAGQRWLPARPAPAPLIPEGPAINLDTYKNLFLPGGPYNVSGMAQAPDGRVFVGVFGSGLLVYGPTFNGTYAWSTISAGFLGLASNNVTSLVVYSGGLWVGTTDAGVSILDLSGNYWSYYNTGNSGIASNNIQRITPNYQVFGAYEVWFSTSNGASNYYQDQGGTFWTNYLGGFISDIAIQYVTVGLSQHEIAWIGTRNDTSRLDVTT